MVKASTHDTLTRHFGVRLKGLREATGESQEAFALRAQIDRTYYAGVESGARNPTLKVLHKIAKGYKLSLSELFEGVR